MDTQNKPTDEDKMIQKLTEHKNLIGWILTLFQKENIQSERTYKNDPKGDIYYPDQKDAKKIFDEAGIALAENIPESEFINVKCMEI